MAREQGNAKLFARERQAKIVELLSQQSKVYVNELSELFGVTPATIRNDLSQLETEGMLIRCHGGAIPAGTVDNLEVDVETRKALRTNEKARIGVAAATFVEDGDVIFIDSGTTTREFVASLETKRDLTIITNDITIAAEAERSIKGVNVVLLGGMMRVGFHCSQGPETISMASRFSAKKLFMSTDSFSLKRGFTTFAPEQAALKQELIRQSEMRFMLVDSSKIETNSMIRFAELSDYDYFITDRGIPDKVNLAISSAEGGPKLVIA